MVEYKIIYRNNGIYKIVDSIYCEDAAYTTLALLLKAGYEDSRIEVVVE